MVETTGGSLALRASVCRIRLPPRAVKAKMAGFEQRPDRHIKYVGKGSVIKKFGP